MSADAVNVIETEPHDDTWVIDESGTPRMTTTSKGPTIYGNTIRNDDSGGVYVDSSRATAQTYDSLDIPAPPTQD